MLIIFKKWMATFFTIPFPLILKQEIRQENFVFMLSGSM